MRRSLLLLAVLALTGCVTYHPPTGVKWVVTVKGPGSEEIAGYATEREWCEAMRSGVRTGTVSECQQLAIVHGAPDYWAFGQEHFGFVAMYAKSRAECQRFRTALFSGAGRGVGEAFRLGYISGAVGDCEPIEIKELGAWRR